MEDQEILAQINKIFSEILKKDIHLSYATTAADVEGWDSLTHSLLIDSVEKHFSVRFKLKEMIRFNNIGDMVSCIKQKLSS